MKNFILKLLIVLAIISIGEFIVGKFNTDIFFVGYLTGGFSFAGLMLYDEINEKRKSKRVTDSVKS